MPGPRTRGTGDRVGRVTVAIIGLDVVLAPIAVVAGFFLLRYSSKYGSSASGFLLMLGTLVQLLVAALVSFKRPGHLVGRLLLASVTVTLVDSAVLEPFVIYANEVTHRAVPGGDLVGTVEQMAWLGFVVPMAILIPLVFPTGRLLSRRWRVVVVVACVGAVLGFLGGAFSIRQDPGSMMGGVRPVRLPDPLPSVADILALALLVLPPCVLAGVASLVLRYRRGDAEERHQLKWLIAAVTTYLVGFIASIVPTMTGHRIPVGPDIAILGLSLIPVAAAIAVLKYRLYDIDVVISRALVYGSLAVFITAVYVAIVVGVGTLVGSGGRPNLVLSIAATAVVAVAFQPVRDRLQRFANRLVYGKRATPYEVLSQFSERVSESYASSEVLPRMARVLAEGCGAVRADVWLRSGSLLTCVGSWPAEAEHREAQLVTDDRLPGQLGAERVVEVRYQGDLLGALTVNKRAGEALTPIEEKLLDDLAHQAGLVLKNVGLTADLQARVDELRASRQRLVAAQDEERRRLERNLHDGAQQHLVALKVKLGLAEMLVDRDLEKATTTIRQLKDDADEALETLRDLARGIYPPLLADRGLVAALEAQARKATGPVAVYAVDVARYSQEIEAAVYFCCLEALQNVQKYAGAGEVEVEVEVHLTGTDASLGFEVSDNGAGFDPGTVKRGSGLQNMEDRLAALDGHLEVQSAPGRGTKLRGWLPVLTAVEAG
ncbi:MAG: hypothetical protein NVS3B24_08630 [Candidatus Dormibacteria bacterium]